MTTSTNTTNATSLFTRSGDDFYFDGKKLKTLLVCGPAWRGTVYRQKLTEELGTAVAKLYDELSVRPESDADVADRVWGDAKWNVPEGWRTNEQGQTRVFYFWLFRSEESQTDKRFLELHFFWWDGDSVVFSYYTGECGRGDTTPRPYRK